jgi:hypothetical protein
MYGELQSIFLWICRLNVAQMVENQKEIIKRFKVSGMKIESFISGKVFSSSFILAYGFLAFADIFEKMIHHQCKSTKLRHMQSLGLLKLGMTCREMNR